MTFEVSWYCPLSFLHFCSYLVVARVTPPALPLMSAICFLTFNQKYLVQTDNCSAEYHFCLFAFFISMEQVESNYQGNNDLKLLDVENELWPWFFIFYFFEGIPQVLTYGFNSAWRRWGIKTKRERQENMSDVMLLTYLETITEPLPTSLSHRSVHPSSLSLD